MFARMEEAQYRALSLEELEERRSAIMEYAAGEDSEGAVVIAESGLCAAEFDRRNAEAQLRAASIAAVQAGSGVVVSQMPDERCGAGAAQEDADPTNTPQYRREFMEYVCKRTVGEHLDAVNKQLRADANTLTTDVGVLVPTNLINRILEKAETYGFILPLVTKTSYPAGMTIPKGSLKPTATWVGEGQGSDRQKFAINDSISFTWHKLRCEVSISMEVSVVTLSAFESKLVDSVARAMTVAKERAILFGDGTTQPKGVLTETAPEGQALSVDKTGKLGLQDILDAEAALPAEYEANARWFMSKKTWLGFQGMVGDDGQPIARVNMGISGKLERSLLGREVVFTYDYLPSFGASMKDGDVFAFIFDMEDYVLNQSYNLGISRKQDWDTEDLLTKAVESVDGKAIDVNSLVVLKAAPAKPASGGQAGGDTPGA